MSRCANRIRTVLGGLTALLALGLPPAAVHATLDAPVKLRLQDGRLAARAGEVYHGVIEVVVPPGLTKSPTIANLRIASPQGWRDVSLPFAKADDLGEAGTHAFPFSALVDDPEQPLVVVVDVDGRAVGRSFLMSEAAILDRTSPVPLVQLEGSGLLDFPGMDLSLPRPDLPSDPPAIKDPAHQADPATAARPEGAPAEGVQDPKDPALPNHDRSIRVYGRFAYRRTDGQVSGVDGAVARVYDDDWCCDELLGQVVTDPWGNFDVTFDWDPCLVCDGEPDIYVEFELDNSVVQVQADDLLEADYTFESGRWNDFDGNVLNVGTQMPGDWYKTASCHIHTTIVRAWRWILVHQGRNVPQVDVQWPSGDKGAKYNDFFEEIHISGERSWSEFTHIHEYGHHFVENFAILNTPDYCNFVCDDDAGAWWPFESCGHCFRCGETNHDAFNEGFPDWMGDTITRAFASEYDPDPIPDGGSFYPNHEMWAACDKAGGSSDPWITEGAFAGMLRDITDANAPADDDPGQPLGIDALSLPTQDIFNLVDWDHPTNPADFIDKFRARFPMHTENLWLTARNNGYDFDAQKPGTPGNLRAPSHFLGGEAPDVTMDIAWDRPADDASGVDAYSYLVMNSVPPMPDTTPELGSATSFTNTSFTLPTPLEPGNYWIALRARDRTGKWSDNYAVAGPYGVRNPDPADLKMLAHVGWNLHSVLPREVGDTPTPANPVPLPPILYGNESGLYQAPFTYVNINYWNQGELPTAAPFWVSTFVDGGFAFTHYQITPLQPVGIGWTPVINQPIVVRGGRHIIGARLDDGEGLAEPNELNNEWARQWGVSAAVALTAGSPVTMAAPPFRYTGAEWIVDGSPIYENSAGVVLNATAPWTSVAVHASGAADYDLRLHALDFSPYTAFGASVASSGRVAGQLDAVFVNANTMGALTYWNVGVVNWSNGFDSFTASKIHSGAMQYGTPVAAAFAAGEMLKLWQISIGAGQTGAVSVRADLDDPTLGPVYLAWLDRGFTVGGLANAAATAVSDPATGHIALSVSVAQAGNYCLVAYRDPGVPTAKRAADPVTVTVQVGAGLPDIIPYVASGWAAPLVPRAVPDGTAANVPAPTQLLGDAESYLNLATWNLAPTVAMTVNTIVTVDGFTATFVPLSEVPATFSAYANSIPWTIPAGRHVLAMAADPMDEIPELIEANNVHGEAWVWTPPTLAANLTVLRGVAADASSGWAHVTNGEPLWPTCDGVRTPVVEPDGQGHGAWGALVVSPIDADMDVALHEAATGPKDGFTVPLVSSAWGAGQSDYVLVNSRLTASRAFDVAITGVGLGGVLTYTYVEYVPSVALGSASGSYGPYVMDDLLDLYELDLAAGSYNLHVRNLAGGVNWGMTVHPADQPFQTKSTSLPDALVDFYGPGEDESILLTIPAAGQYAVAIWKGSTADAAVAGTYELIVSPGATAAPPTSPATLTTTTALRGAHPNPFNPRTSIAFDLAHEGPARVDVYTLRGRHVRSLLSQARPAGRHEVVWQGDDATGRPVASGVYLVRLSAAGVVDQRKIVLAK